MRLCVATARLMLRITSRAACTSPEEEFARDDRDVDRSDPRRGSDSALPDESEHSAAHPSRCTRPSWERSMPHADAAVEIGTLDRTEVFVATMGRYPPGHVVLIELDDPQRRVAVAGIPRAAGRST